MKKLDGWVSYVFFAKHMSPKTCQCSNNIGLSFCTLPTNFVQIGENELVVKYRREGK